MVGLKSLFKSSRSLLSSEEISRNIIRTVYPIISIVSKVFLLSLATEAITHPFLELIKAMTLLYKDSVND